MIHEQSWRIIIIEFPVTEQYFDTDLFTMQLLWTYLAIYSISLVVHSVPFLDLTYPNMQIEKRSQAILKIPGGEWTIQLARTERGI